MKRNIVFVVDDDPGTLRGLRRLLREYGYDSVLFPSAEAFQNHDDFEAAVCIILDINLNNESGIELRRVASRAPEFPYRSSTSRRTTAPPSAWRRSSPDASRI